MKKRINIIKRIKIGLVIVLLFFLLFNPYGGVSILRLIVKIKTIEKKINEIKAKEIVLRHEVKLLEKDKNYIKKIKEKKLGIKGKNG